MHNVKALLHNSADFKDKKTVSDYGSSSNYFHVIYMWLDACLPCVADIDTCLQHKLLG